jgi:hypothetical protein
MEYPTAEDGFDEADFSEWIDDVYRNWAIAMGFDNEDDITQFIRWHETDGEDGDYCV